MTRISNLRFLRNIIYQYNSGPRLVARVTQLLSNIESTLSLSLSFLDIKNVRDKFYIYKELGVYSKKKYKNMKTRTHTRKFYVENYKNTKELSNWWSSEVSSPQFTRKFARSCKLDRARSDCEILYETLEETTARLQAAHAAFSSLSRARALISLIN